MVVSRPIRCVRSKLVLAGELIEITSVVWTGENMAADRTGSRCDRFRTKTALRRQGVGFRIRRRRFGRHASTQTALQHDRSVAITNKKKFCLSTSENPWIAAQRFLNKHELPQTYADEVVGFIEKNSGGVQLGQGGESNTYVDPYTGASRYTGASGSSGPHVGGGDPFTGRWT